MSTHDKNTELERSDVPATFEDPGLPEHRYRMGDTDPAANKRSERQVVVLFAISVLGAVGALVAYFALPLGSDPMSVRWATLGLGLDRGQGAGRRGVGRLDHESDRAVFDRKGAHHVRRDQLPTPWNRDLPQFKKNTFL